MKADYIFVGSAIFTGGGEPLLKGIVAVCGGEVAYVGSGENIRDLTGPETKVIDVGDRLLAPGFIDAHEHLYFSAFSLAPFVASLLDCASEEECAARLGTQADAPTSNGWVFGMDWYHLGWERPSLPTKRSLDLRFPNTPVCLIAQDLHSVWLNSAALAKLGLERDSVPPGGGTYARFDDGELTGVAKEAAATSLLSQIIRLPAEEELSLYRKMLRGLCAQGITSVCDMGLSTGASPDFVREDILDKLLSRGELSARVRMFPSVTTDTGRLRSLSARYTGGLLGCGGGKQFFDGVSSSHTALLKTPYANADFEGDCGCATVEPERMRRIILGAAAQGFGVRVHAIGDEAIHLLIDYFSEAEGLYEGFRGAPHSIEHLENLQPEDIARIGATNIVASVQPMHLVLDPAGIERDLGAERTPYSWPFKSLIDHGAALAFGTDAPIVDANPMETLYAAVTRQYPRTGLPEGGWYPGERITLSQALEAYTAGAAMAAGLGGGAGRLAPGTLADIVVLDRNMFSRPAEELLETRVELTMVNGAVVYDTGALTADGRN